MKWIGKQTIYDHVKFASGINIDSIDITSIQSSSESFANNDTSLMTSAAIEDKILSYGYSTATGDITGVTAGDHLNGGGTSGTVTLNVDVATTSSRGAASFNSDNFDVSSGAVSITNGGIGFSALAGSSVTTSSESFADNDTTLMTSAAINDRIESFGYTTNTGDITGVTAGTNLSGGGSSGTVTINLADASTSTKGAASFHSDNFSVSSGAVVIKTGGIDEDHINTGAVSIEKIAGAAIVTEGERIGSNDNDDTIPTCAAVNDHISTTSSLTSLAAVGTITTGVWEGTAIATAYTKHIIHYRFMGYSIGDGTNYEMPQPLTDGQAPFEHDDASSADGLTIPSGNGTTNVSEMIRMGGHVMARAGTLKKWKGWASCNDSGGNYFVALFKWSPVENNSTDISASHGGLTMLDEATIVGKNNDKVMPIEETTFTSAAVAEGDIIFTQVKTTTSGRTVYFNTTLEIEM